MDSTSLRRCITNLKYVTAVDCCNGCRQRANCRRLHDGYTSSARTVDLTEVGAETHLLETGRGLVLQPRGEGTDSAALTMAVPRLCSAVNFSWLLEQGARSLVKLGLRDDRLFGRCNRHVSPRSVAGLPGHAPVAAAASFALAPTRSS